MYAREPIVAAQAIPPRAFQSRNRGQGVRSAPASHPQARQPASEEDGSRAPAGEKHLPALDQAPPSGRQPPGPADQPAKAFAPDQVADVVADDRCAGGDPDHEREREPPLRGQRGGHDQGCLAGDQRPCRFAADEREEQRVAKVGRDVEERRQHQLAKKALRRKSAGP
jgi:hypothetical protein